MNKDKVSKLEEEQLDNVKGGSALVTLLLLSVPAIATGIGGGLAVLASHLAKKKDAEAGKASKKR